jgi:hypothetical protein
VSLGGAKRSLSLRISSWEEQRSTAMEECGFLWVTFVRCAPLYNSGGAERKHETKALMYATWVVESTNASLYLFWPPHMEEHHPDYRHKFRQVVHAVLCRSGSKSFYSCRLREVKTWLCKSSGCGWSISHALLFILSMKPPILFLIVLSPAPSRRCCLRRACSSRLSRSLIRLIDFINSRAASYGPSTS